MTLCGGNQNSADLALAVEAWGTIMGAVDKLTWLRRVDEYIAEGMAPDLLAQLAIRLATQRMNQRTGLAWVSPETLGNDIGKSRTSVTRALEAAVDAGLLEIVDKADADGASAPRSTGSPCRRTNSRRMHRLRKCPRMDIWNQHPILRKCPLVDIWNSPPNVHPGRFQMSKTSRKCPPADMNTQ